jgi:uncharacterized protein
LVLKTVIDTNVWVSALLNPAGYPAKLLKTFEKGNFGVVVSEPILEEIADVLCRPRIRDKYEISEEDIKELLTLIEARAESVSLSGNIDVCRDKDDNFIIETAINGNAQYIVSRDDDIKFNKEITQFLLPYGISVISVNHFLTLIE